MIKVVDECVRACPERMCDSSCPNLNVKRYYCDCCGEEFEPDELYDYDGEMLCKDCLVGKFTTIEEMEL